MEFKDTTLLQASNPSLPPEAMNFGGFFLEDLVPGFRTLNVTGRELMSSEVNSYQLGIRDGERSNYTRIPAREIVVLYQLIAEDNESFRDRYNKLNVALYSESDKVTWFNDEPEMYFYAQKSSVEQVPPGVNMVTGTFTMRCNDPYKYSKSDATLVVWGSREITFQANYLMGNTGSGAVKMPVQIDGGAFWGSNLITFQHQGYLMGDTGKEAKPVEIYPTVEGMKVKPTITIEGSGQKVWVKTRKDTIDLGDFNNATFVIDTKNFYISKNGKPDIRPMNDFYLYPGEPLYVSAASSDFLLTIEYPNRYL